MRIILAINMEDEFERELVSQFGRELQIKVAAAVGEQDKLVSAITEHRPDAVVISEYLPGKKEILEYLRELRETVAGRAARLVMLGDEHEPKDQFLSTCISLGIYDIFFGNINYRELVSSLSTPRTWSDVADLLDPRNVHLGEKQTEETKENALAALADELAVGNQTVAAFWSPKPGTGVSTLAFSAAVALAQSGFRTALVELDWHYPSLAMRSGLSHPERTTEQAYRDFLDGRPTRLKDRLITQEWMLEHLNKNRQALRSEIKSLPNNLAALSIGESTQFSNWPKEQQGVVVDMVSALTLKLNYDCVILDIPSGPATFSTSDSLHCATKIYIVLEPDISIIPVLRDRIESLNLLLGIDILKKSYFVINKFKNNSELIIENLAEALGAPLELVIPAEPKTAIQYTAVSRPLVLSETPVGESLRRLANHVQGLGEIETAFETRKNGLFKNFFSRKQKVGGVNV